MGNRKPAEGRSILRASTPARHLAVSIVYGVLAVVLLGIAPSLASSVAVSDGPGFGTTPPTVTSASQPGTTYFPVAPARILDSRDATGGLVGPFISHVARTFQVTGAGGVPGTATAVTGNLTVTQQSYLGYLYVGPIAMNYPTSSTLNFPKNDDRANAVTVALGAGGTLSVTYAAPAAAPGATAHVIFDVTGYFAPDTTGAVYIPLAPARILDTRNGTGGLPGPFGSHVACAFQVAGNGGVPANATAVTGNLTVTEQTYLGFLFIGPIAMNYPTSSTLNFPKNDDRANAVTVALGSGGTLSITYAAPAAGGAATAHVVFDVTGYFAPNTEGNSYYPVTPARILDSRDGTGGLGGAFTSHVARTFQAAGAGGVPADAIAVTGNLTVTGQSYLGYLYIGPVAMNYPTSSTLNFPKNDDRANAVTVALGSGGTLSITYAAPAVGGAATAHVIFDVTGYFTPDTSGPATWSLDLYDSRADRWQDPDMTGCTAAATESMLNTISYTGSSSGLTWHATTAFDVEESIMAYEREHMTMLLSSEGTDPHGWRNALNYYGWGDINAGVYRDSSYSSFDAATKEAVSAMARFHEPVGILAHSGRHSQYITGYQVTGDDPSTGSMDFTIVGVDVTDTLESANRRDSWVSLPTWRSGDPTIQFTAYAETDSPYTDPIDGQVGTTEWYGQWVILEPVK